MTSKFPRIITMFAFITILGVLRAAAAENVILVIADGLRWQEVFRGADINMLTPENRVTTKTREAVRQKYDAETTEARRAKLMPFLWSHVARIGQIYGNRDKGSVVRVANTHWFSYPGYNELLTGSPDDERVKSNDHIPNPNVTVFEWLAKKPEMNGRVAAFAAWDAFSAIFNSARCGFPVDAADKPFEPTTGVTCGMEMINRIRATTPSRWSSEPFDSLVFPMASEYIKQQKPRAVFLGLGEPDEWAHEGDYPSYLASIQRTDNWLKELTYLMESMPEYRGKTTIIFAADHGRGDAAQSPTAWNGHGRENAHSDAVFFAIWGPDTPARGEVQGGDEITLSQTAATVAAAIGYDYVQEQPKAAPPIKEALSIKTAQ